MSKSRPNQKSLDSYVGGVLPGSPPSSEIAEEQKAMTPADLNLSTRQIAKRTANDEAFQPWAGQMLNDGVNSVPASRDARIVGDMVTGDPQDDYPRDEYLTAVLGGRSILVAGANSAVLPAPPEHPAVTDWANQKGTGDTPMQPGGQTGT
jgi:hypothetical protein